jgi:hypothetical protein
MPRTVYFIQQENYLRAWYAFQHVPLDVERDLLLGQIHASLCKRGLPFEDQFRSLMRDVSTSLELAELLK